MELSPVPSMGAPMWCQCLNQGLCPLYQVTDLLPPRECRQWVWSTLVLPTFPHLCCWHSWAVIHSYFWMSILQPSTSSNFSTIVSLNHFIALLTKCSGMVIQSLPWFKSYPLFLEHSKILKSGIWLSLDNERRVKVVCKHFSRWGSGTWTVVVVVLVWTLCMITSALTGWVTTQPPRSLLFTV